MKLRFHGLFVHSSFTFSQDGRARERNKSERIWGGYLVPFPHPEGHASSFLPGGFEIKMLALNDNDM